MEREPNYINLESIGISSQEIKKIISDGAAPGCSLALSKPDNGIESVSFGRIGEVGSQEVTPHTVYDLASITKLYTTALIIRLHEESKLSIHNKCADYLNNFSGSEATILDLLTHKVNFDIRLSEYRSLYVDRYNLETALMNIKPPETSGPNINYGNIGFFYLGKIIEKIQNCSLNDAMKKFFQELGLLNTYTGTDIRKLEVITPPTEIIDGQVIQGVTHDETARILGGVAGNAGIFATARDVAKFGVAWVEGRIAATDELRHVVFGNHDQSGSKSQAVGWWLRIPTPEGEISTPELYTHTGFTGSLLAINLKNNKVCAFTCNRTFYGRDNTKQKEIWSLLTDWAQT